MIDAVIDRFGLTRMPFGRDLPPGRLHRHADCAEAAARITWAVAGRTIGVITGEVGTGKTAAVRAAVAGLDPAGHNVIYIGNPATGVRGINAAVVTALGGLACPRHRSPGRPGLEHPRRRGRRTRTHPGPDPRRGPPPRPRAARVDQDAHQPRDGLKHPVRDHPRRPADPAAQHQARRAGGPGPADHRPLPDEGHDWRRDSQLHPPPPRSRRPAPPTCSPTTPSPRSTRPPAASPAL